MSYKNIAEAIRLVDSVKSWESILISYNHARKPFEYVCHSFKFQDAGEFMSLIKAMSNTFIDYIDSKDKIIVSYNGMNPKGSVDKLEINNALIKDAWTSLIQHINICDDTENLEMIKANAFIFVGNYETSSKENKAIYFLCRRNPIVNLKRRLFSARANTVEIVDKPLFQFGNCFDAIICNGTMYAINDNFEGIFNLEQTKRNICNAHLTEIKSKGIIGDFEAYKSYALSGHNPSKFLSFSTEVFDNACKDSGKKVLQDKFKIPMTLDGKKFDLSNDENAKVFTLLVCDKTKRNVFDEDYCEVPSSTPMVLQ